MKFGQPADVSLNFRSDGKPSSLVWIVGGRKIYYGAKASKFVSREIVALGDGLWKAVLHITNLNYDDTLLNYTLNLKNNFGKVDYLVKINGIYETTTAGHDETTTEGESDDTTSGENYATTITNIEDDVMTTTGHVEEISINFDSVTEDDFEIEPTTQAPDDISEELIETSTELVADESTFDSIDSDILPTETIESTPSEEFQSTFPMTHLQTTKVPSTTNKVGRKLSIQIYKRRINRILPASTTESMVTITQKEDESLFDILQSGFIDIISSALRSWKTSLMILIILLLVISLSYYRRRVVRLKAEIVQKNLSNSFYQSCSYPQTANAYTPTLFPRRQTANILKGQSSSDSEYESSGRSRSNFYSLTYNSSLHLYESIDDEPPSENLYAEIITRKNSIISIDVKPNNYESDPVSQRKSQLFPSVSSPISCLFRIRLRSSRLLWLIKAQRSAPLSCPAN